jgi:hypothetical protein
MSHSTAVVLMLMLAAGRAGAQTAYEMRCRGGSGGDAFDWQHPDLSSRTVVLRFRPSPSAAGANGAGLLPGTCSWIDRPLNSAEPHEIRFTAPMYPGGDMSQPLLALNEATEGRIIVYLADSDRYWNFFVYNTNQGYMQALNHNPWRATLGRRRLPGSRRTRQGP